MPQQPPRQRNHLSFNIAKTAEVQLHPRSNWKEEYLSHIRKTPNKLAISTFRTIPPSSHLPHQTPQRRSWCDILPSKTMDCQCRVEALPPNLRVHSLLKTNRRLVSLNFCHPFCSKEWQEDAAVRQQSPMAQGRNRRRIQRKRGIRSSNFWWLINSRQLPLHRLRNHNHNTKRSNKKVHRQLTCSTSERK